MSHLAFFFPFSNLHVLLWVGVFGQEKFAFSGYRTMDRVEKLGYRNGNNTRYPSISITSYQMPSAELTPQTQK